ncbi:MAG: pilus assembly protein, partial [Rhodobiaceae bacterium]|nr:pilus assembly protein [Rhodobiaceae bacterium]
MFQTGARAMMNQLRDLMVVRALQALAALSAFQKNRQGNVAVIFALAMMPIVAAAGAGVDLSRAYLVKAHLTQALDAAGLAVAGTPGASEAQIMELAQSFFKANYPESEIGVAGELSVN